MSISAIVTSGNNQTSSVNSLQSGRAPLLSPRDVLFVFLAIASLLVFHTALKTLVHHALWGGDEYDQYSYTLAIPFIALALLISERKRIFADVRYCYPAGLSLLFAAIFVKWLAGHSLPHIGADNSLSMELLALVAVWLGIFMLCYGSRAFRTGAFALSFLLLTVPVPNPLLEKPIAGVRYGSTEVCTLIFTMLRVHFQRDGFVFHLTHTDFIVATECSGIHSSLAILIMSLLAGHVVLSSAWKKLALVMVALPIVCITNGLRIAGLTLLAEYVDPSILQSNLHRQGGMAFFALALLLLLGFLKVLRRFSNAQC